MSKRKKQLVGKIGYCSNQSLGILNSQGNYNGGHYVYIQKLNKDGTCNVNVVTSLEDSHGNFDMRKLAKVKRGQLYCVPKKDLSLRRWSALNLDTIKNVRTNRISIQNIKMKKRHRFFVGKYSK